MKLDLASLLFCIALVAGLMPPGEGAYVGAYVTMGAGALGLLLYAWPERAALLHPVSLAIVLAIVLISLNLPFVYRSDSDLMAPILLLPMLTAIGLGLSGGAARRFPGATVFAALCLVAVGIAFLGGAYEYLTFGTSRVGLGNNPIHYASLAVLTGGLALVGVVSTASPWRLLFLAGPLLGFGAAILSGSRGPLAAAVVLAATGFALLLVWFWRDRLFRFAVLAILLVGVLASVYLIGSGNDRGLSVIETALNIFRFTGSSDDIRAALYASALHILGESPLLGVGLGQIMDAVQALYPEQSEVFTLDNLHADWANFAVIAGVPGLVAWVLLFCAPLKLLWDRRLRADRPTVLAAVLLSAGQLALGVSNATFGILPQTVLYAVILGYFFARAHRLANAQPVSLASS